MYIKSFHGMGKHCSLCIFSVLKFSIGRLEMERFGIKHGVTSVEVRTRIVNLRRQRKTKEKKMRKELQIDIV